MVSIIEFEAIQNSSEKISTIHGALDNDPKLRAAAPSAASFVLMPDIAPALFALKLARKFTGAHRKTPGNKNYEERNARGEGSSFVYLARSVACIAREE